MPILTLYDYVIVLLAWSMCIGIIFGGLRESDSYTHWRMAWASVAALVFWTLVMIGTEALDLQQVWFQVWLSSHPSEGAKLLIPFGAILLGLVAHWFKRLSKRWYGVTEVLFAVIVAAKLSGEFLNKDTELAALIALASCIYIISRGLSNISDSGLHIDIATLVRIMGDR